MKTEATCSSKTSANFQLTTPRCIQGIQLFTVTAVRTSYPTKCFHVRRLEFICEVPETKSILMLSIYRLKYNSLIKDDFCLYRLALCASASQNIPLPLRYSRVPCRIYKRTPADHILKQINPTHSFSPHSFKIHLNIIHISTPKRLQMIV